MRHLLKRLSRRRNRRARALWDNVNTPGGKGASAPTTPISSTQGVDNSFTPGPQIEPYLASGWTSSPYRLHSPADQLQPIIPVTNPMAAPKGVPARTRIRDVEWDAGNPATLRKPDQPLQQYFNERIPLQEFTTPSVPAHGVQCNIYPVQSGWEQAFVPQAGMRANDIGIAPPVLLSRPLRSKTLTGSVDGHRSPIKAAKAPTRKRAGG